MSRGKWTNPRTDKKVQVGGKMNPGLAEWVKQNGGFRTVEKATEIYKKSIEDSVMQKLKYAVIVKLQNGDELSSSEAQGLLPKNKAVSLAQEWAKDYAGEGSVFLTFSDKSQGQSGYLNPDGNHSPVGKSW